MHAVSFLTFLVKKVLEVTSWITFGLIKLLNSKCFLYLLFYQNNIQIRLILIVKLKEKCLFSQVFVRYNREKAAHKFDKHLVRHFFHSWSVSKFYNFL